MILCLDVGNSHIFGGIFVKDQVQLQFRYNTKQVSTSDQIGIFLRNVIRENGLDHSGIKKIALCSVVPSLDYSIRSACIKYFNIEPFILQAGVKTGLKIKTHHPKQVGSDLIAGVIAASYYYPQQHCIVADLGTVTTFSIVNVEKEYLGAVFLPGIKTSMIALNDNAAMLPLVEIEIPQQVVGRNTIESIQSGLYFGHLTILQTLPKYICQECFAGKKAILIGTGGFSQLFDQNQIFDAIEPQLVLKGLLLALQMNS